MQGLWKNKRKHFLKDKCFPIYKTHMGFRRKIVDKSIYSYDCTYIKPFLDKKTKSKKVFSICYNGKVYEMAYEMNGSWYDFYTNKKIFDFKFLNLTLNDFGNFKVLDFLFETEIKVEFKPKNLKEFKSKEMLYGKPLDNEFEIRTRHMYKKSKKWYKKYVSGKDRTILRKHKKHLLNGQYDNNMDTHSYSKSLDYLIY